MVSVTKRSKLLLVVYSYTALGTFAVYMHKYRNQSQVRLLDQVARVGAYLLVRLLAETLYGAA